MIRRARNDPEVMARLVQLVRYQALQQYFVAEPSNEPSQDGAVVCCDQCGELTTYSHANSLARFCLSEQCIEKAVQVYNDVLNIIEDDAPSHQ